MINKLNISSSSVESSTTTSTHYQQKYDYLWVLDFEATCWEEYDTREIIEFPTVIVDIKTRKIIDQFNTFVKPTDYPTLSDFCKKLTSITQKQVDLGIKLKEACHKHYDFIQKYKNGVFVTCGNWDLQKMLPMDCKRHDLKIPSIYKQWINIKTAHKDLYNKPQAGGSMHSMLKFNNLELLGTHHRGIDDCVNIARIGIKMLEDNWNPVVNGYYN